MRAVRWVAAILLSVLVLWGLSPLGFRLPVFKYEPLTHPQRVVGWSERGLRLTNGRVVLPKGMKALPRKSAALTELARRGVEVGHDGRVFGQVNLWHWCGNDPVRTDVRRVDVAHVLAFLREGKSSLKFVHKPYGNLDRQISSDRGWSISGYLTMAREIDQRTGKIKKL